MLVRALRWYKRALRLHPWKVQIATTGVLMGVGDVIAQAFFAHQPLRTYSIKETARFTLLGVAYVAPAVQSWYIVLQRYVGGFYLARPLIMVAADQLFFAPVSLAVFLVLLRGLEGKTARECHESIRHDWWKIYKAGLQIWPLFQCVNFYLVPLEYRLIVGQAFSLAWNTFIAHQARETQHTSSGVISRDRVAESLRADE